MSTSFLQQLHPEVFRDLLATGVLRDLDLHLVAAVARTHQIQPSASPAGALALALASKVVDDGHVCLDLRAVSAAWVAGQPQTDGEADTAPIHSDIAAWCCAMADPAARQRLFAGWENAIGGATDTRPFVLHGHRLYLRRMFDYERNVAVRLREMAGGATTAITAETDKQVCALLEDERQRVAARMALTRRLTIISGGPGTGKTHTAARILALLSRQPGGATLRVRLAAPTGKAAARMGESIRAARQQAAVAFGSEMVIEEACTLERLLGFQAGSPYFQHNETNPIEADVVLVDEASMVDLARMSKLLDALGPQTRLVLLGDMHQLAAVQPGSVLAEICEASALKGCVAELTVSRRFPPGSAIDCLSRAINSVHVERDAQEAWAGIRLFAGSGPSDCRVATHDAPSKLAGRGHMTPDFSRAILAGYRAFLAAGTPEQAFAALAEFRILCALRSGPLGVVSVNRLVEEVLSLRGVRAQDLAPELQPVHKLDPAGEFYSHRVILVTRNDYAINLFNGDVGVVLPDRESNGELAVYFQGAGAGADIRKVPCRLLPEHETAFAMTIHKSQGSEFARVLILLPPVDSPILTRELVYTAITRASRNVELWCNPDTFARAAARRLARFTGLREQLDSSALPQP